MWSSFFVNRGIKQCGVCNAVVPRIAILAQTSPETVWLNTSLLSCLAPFSAMTNAHENARTHARPDQGATAGGVTGRWRILLWTGTRLWLMGGRTPAYFLLMPFLEVTQLFWISISGWPYWLTIVIVVFGDNQVIEFDDIYLRMSHIASIGHSTPAQP